MFAEDLKPTGALTIQGDLLIVAERDLKVDSGGRVIIDGRVELVVYRDLLLTDGTIELMPDATLTIYIGDDLELNRSYIGDAADDTRDNTGAASYFDTTNIAIHSMDTLLETARLWELSMNSVVKGSLYAPTADLAVADDSALYGRVAAERVTVNMNGAIFYDHALDPRRGYTSVDTDIFTQTGDIDPAFLGMSSLDPANLVALADSRQIFILAGGEILGMGPPVVPPPPPTDPTPRPVPVDFTLSGFGSTMTQWEHRETQEGGGGGGD